MVVSCGTVVVVVFVLSVCFVCNWVFFFPVAYFAITSPSHEGKGKVSDYPYNKTSSCRIPPEII